ncbi:MAG: hypothetical protein AAF682_10540 [Planctomycetota bacterium]
MSNPELPDFDREWNYADPAATEARFREIYTSAEGSADADYLAELTTQIARTYSLRGRFDEAHDELDELAPKLQGAGAAPRVRYLLERARTHNSAGEKERATELFLQAWEIAHEAGEEYHAADALHMLGLSTPPEEGLKWNERAMEYCESCTDPLARRWLGPLYHNTWMTYLEREDYDTALELAQKSRAFRDETDDDEGERIGRWSIFHTQRKMGRVDEALAGFRALLTDYGPEGDDSGFCDEEIAECLHALGREDEAKPHFAAAYEHLKDVRWLRESDPARLARLRQLAGE